MKIPIIAFALLIVSPVMADLDYGNGSYGNDTYGGSNTSSPPTVIFNVNPKTIATVATVQINCEAHDANGVKSVEVKVDGIVECIKTDLAGPAELQCEFSYRPSDHNDITKNYTTVCKATNIFDLVTEKADSFYAVKDTGGGGGGGGAGNPVVNASNATSTPPGTIITNITPPPKPIEEKPVQVEPPSAIVQLNLTGVIEDLRAWAGEVSKKLQKSIQPETVEALLQYARRATDLPNYSQREKVLLIFTILSLIFILIKPRRGPEHHVHKIMKRIIIGSDKKHLEKEKKFIGKIKFADGRFEFCYEIPGKDFACYRNNLAELAEEVKKSFGPDFRNNLTYDVPHKKLRNAKFIMLTPKERNELENLVNVKPKTLVHHAVHKMHQAVKHAVKHIKKEKPSLKPKPEPTKPKPVPKQKPIQKPQPKPARRKKRDKYLDFYKKVRKAKSLKEISKADLE